MVDGDRIVVLVVADVALSSALDFEDGQMLSTCEVAHDESQPGYLCNNGLDVTDAAISTRGFASNLEFGLVARWESSFVDFVRRTGSTRLVRTMFVVPGCIRDQLLLECMHGKRHDDPARALAFQRSDEAFHDGNRAVLSDGSKTRFDDA